jgi:hypothetical protein
VTCGRNGPPHEIEHGGVPLMLMLLVVATSTVVKTQNQTPNQSQTQPTTQSPAPTAPPAADSEQGNGVLPNPKRMLDVMPNFDTVNETQTPLVPLTTRQKYELALWSTYDISVYPGLLVEAGIEQLTNGEPHYGRNVAALVKRFAATEGDQATSSLFRYGLLPALLKEDPRYFRRGRGPAWNRVSHAIAQIVVIRSDAGGYTFNAPVILGRLMQAGISNLYYPAQDRSATGTARDVGINVLYDAGFNVLKEFYPDLLNKLKRRHATTQPNGS